MPVKAYKNPDFIDSREARILRIMAEYLETEKRMREAGIEDTVVFFGSARIPSREDAEKSLAALQKEKKATKKDITRAERAVEMSRYYEAARELAFRLTQWAKELAVEKTDPQQRFAVVTGGGPGIMEAANRGAEEAGGSTIGMNISLPFEQHENPYVTRELAFDFHYFFMRKFWFSYLAKAMVVFPGGYGTLDEFFELMTLVSTRKMGKAMPVVLYGSEYWNEILNLDAMVKYGTISPSDLELFHCSDSVDDAFEFLTNKLSEHHVDKPGGAM